MTFLFRSIQGCGAALVVLLCGAAHAEPPGEVHADPEEAPTELLTSDSGDDATRFRFGVQTGHGALFDKNNPYFFTGTDLRLGAQLMDSLGIYAVPRLGFYFGGNDESGMGGLLGIGGGFDWTFADRFFVGAGAGMAKLTTPLMLDLSLRAGGYLAMSRSDTKVRRHGFLIALDLHYYRGSYYRVYNPVLSLGYEAF